MLKSEVLLMVLDARDPFGCRCAELEAWARENNKRLLFVLTKSDLVSPQMTSRWLQWLRQVAPVVAVQAEAGREGVAELLRLIGQGAPAVPDGPAPLTPVASVGVIGFPGTGKKSLCKAIRREAKGGTKWLLEAVGRLREEPTDATAAASRTLHFAIRGLLPRLLGNEGNSESTAAGPLTAAVQLLLELAGPQVVMRRFRLPSFDGVQNLITSFVKDRSLKTKKGKEPTGETAAHRLLTELAAAPGSVCVPPEGAPAVSEQLWKAHDSSKPQLESLMQAQIGQLETRDVGPAASALTLSSAPGLAPSVNLKKSLETVDEEDEDEALMEESDAEGEEEELEEEGEEEEEGEDDDEMEDE